jgi:hypothetical protein
MGISSIFQHALGVLPTLRHQGGIRRHGERVSDQKQGGSRDYVAVKGGEEGGLACVRLPSFRHKIPGIISHIMKSPCTIKYHSNPSLMLCPIRKPGTIMVRLNSANM